LKKESNLNGVLQRGSRLLGGF